MHVAEWLNTVRARDVMTREVVTLGPDDPISDAAHLLLREQISGAPVVNDLGICVGVFSASDVLAYEEDRATQESIRPSIYYRTPEEYEVGTEEWTRWEEVQQEFAEEPEATVEQYMTRDLVTVRDETPLAEVIRQMLDAHIHRILVVDEQSRLVGIITTTDVLGALLRQASRERAVGAGQ